MRSLDWTLGWNLGTRLAAKCSMVVFSLLLLEYTNMKSHISHIDTFDDTATSICLSVCLSIICLLIYLLFVHPFVQLSVYRSTVSVTCHHSFDSNAKK